jgi:selenide,water dikinase
VRDVVVAGDTDETTVKLLADAQTNGGLLLAVPGRQVDALTDHLGSSGDGVAVIGRLVERADTVAIVLEPE